MDKLLIEQLESAFKDVEVNILDNDRIVVSVKKEVLLDVLRFLKNKGFDHLALISCVDWIEEKKFELVYILTPYPEKRHIILKARISREKADFETAIPVFKNAEPYEREIHELFGINFAGHPRLTPLFLEREYKIPPFRKDFDSRKYVEETFDSVPSVKDKK